MIAPNNSQFRCDPFDNRTQMHGYARHTACRWFIWELPITETVVFAVIKSSCGRWRDVIGVVRKSQRRKAKATLNDVTIVAVTEDAIHNTIGRPHIGICGFDGWFKDERIETNVAIALWCRTCHANTLKPLVRSLIPGQTSPADASRCRK